MVEVLLVVIGFFLEFAKVFYHAGSTFGLAGDAGVSAMKDEPVVSVDQKLLWDETE